MGFKNMKRDDHGHVISNDETDGQKCQHVSGQADKVEDQKYNKEMKKAQEQNALMSEAFDDTWDEEFNEPDEARGPYDEVDFNKVKDVIDDQFGGPEGNPSKKQVEEVVFDRFNNINPEDEAKIKEMINKKFNKANSDIKYDKEDAEKFKNAGFDVASEEEVNEIFGKDNLNPNNPKYKGFKRSDITNAKIIDKGKKVHNYDKNEDETLSIIEYVPYGALQDGDNRKLYGVVRNYDGSDTPKIGAIVSPNLESAKEDLQHQIELSEQGSERYLKRGKWDEEWFNMLNDKEYDFDDDTKKKYSEKYGWDFSKPWNEQKHIKGK